MNINVTKPNDYFRTSDLPLAAVLFCFGHEIVAIDRTEKRRVILEFERIPELDDIVEAFWKRALSVEPQAYFQSIKLVKSRIYSEQ